MNTQWKPVLEYLGWRQVDIPLPIFAKESDGQTYFVTIPDTSGGVIPVGFNLTRYEQEEIHNYLSGWADHIVIGDLLDNWKLPYQELPIDFQVIPTKDLKLEKDTRNQINQAKRYGVIVRDMIPEDNYWSCVRSTSKRQNRSGIDKGTLDVMRSYFKGLVAEYKGKIIAGCLYGDDMHLVHSASLSRYQKYRPNHVIYNRLIEIANGREIYLGNSPKELIGLKKFKESFGAELRTFKIKIWKNPIFQ